MVDGQAVQQISLRSLRRVWRKHGVEPYAAITVKTDPIVGEQGIRSVGFGVAVIDSNLDAMLAQSGDDAIEFFLSALNSVPQVRSLQLW